MTSETKPAGNKAPKIEKIKGLRVRSVPKHFHRAGHRFTQEPVEIALDELSKDAVTALKAEPMLVVEETTIERPAADNTTAEG